jgi:hypothetical protein
MTITLFVEGPSDKKTFPILVKRILGRSAAKTKIVCRTVGQGGLFNARKVKAYVQHDIAVKHPDCDRIIVVVDSECTPYEETQTRVTKVERQLKSMRARPLPHYCVAYHALEAWLGADLEALKHVAGKPVKLSESILEACKPKEVLEESFRKSGKNFDHMRDDPRIAEMIDLNIAARNNPSFAHFVKLVKGR